MSLARIERFNGGRMRRYCFANGAIAVVSRQAGGRRCSVSLTDLATWATLDLTTKITADPAGARHLYVWAICERGEIKDVLVDEVPPPTVRMADYHLVRPKGYSGWHLAPADKIADLMLDACGRVGAKL